MSDRLRFGRFEFDPRSGDLRREGRPVHLAPQPLRVLAILLSRPGALVTRREIQERIWPDEPSRVTRDQGLNACIARIRDALGERASAPVYIETHPKRGYRFIAPVERAGGPAGRPDSASSRETLGAAARRLRHATLARLPAAALVGLLVLAGGLAIGSARSPGSGGLDAERPRVRIALLPLDDRTAGAGRGAVAEGIAEELAMRLTGVAPDRLAIIAYASSSLAHAQGRSLSQMAHTLDVDYFLEGRLSEGSQGLAVSLQLVRADDLAYVWDGALRSEFVGFQDLADTVGTRLARTLSLDGAPTSLAGRRPDEPDERVRAAYLTGRRLLDVQTLEGARRSLPHLAKVATEDPGFAGGHARYATALFWAGDRERAEREALRALELDPTLAEPHRLLADIRLDRDFDWAAADRHYRKAMELGRGRHEFPHAYAHFLVSRGRAEEALAFLARARELNPLSPVLESDVGWVEYWAGRYERAADACRRSVPLLPLEIRARAHRCALHALIQLGRHEEARERALEIMDLGRASPSARKAVRAGPARRGLRAYHRWAIRPENQELALGSTSAFARARGRADLGEVEAALALLEEALRSRPRGLTTVAVEPRLAALHRDPRFARILERIGLEPTAEALALR